MRPLYTANLLSLLLKAGVMGFTLEQNPLEKATNAISSLARKAAYGIMGLYRTGERTKQEIEIDVLKHDANEGIEAHMAGEDERAIIIMQGVVSRAKYFNNAEAALCRDLAQKVLDMYEKEKSDEKPNEKRRKLASYYIKRIL